MKVQVECTEEQQYNEEYLDISVEGAQFIEKKVEEIDHNLPAMRRITVHSMIELLIHKG